MMRWRPTVDLVIDAVGGAMSADRRTIVARHSRAPARAVAIYLSFKLTGRKQREIGEVFGIGRFAVSKVAAMLEHRLI